MKKFFGIFILIFSEACLAGRGVVLVLETPLFHEPNIDSTIVQYVRKGNIIYISDYEIGVSSYSKDYEKNLIDPWGETEQVYERPHTKSNDETFYTTVDKSGTLAYVLRSHIKPITQDTREAETKINPFDHDPMDYRIEEPLPPDYPFKDIPRHRGSIAFLLSPARKINYPYTLEAKDQHFGNSMGVSITYTKNAKFDHYNRFYFGGEFHVLTENATFSLGENQRTATESKKQFSLGPYASYDIFRREQYLLTLGGGILANMNSASVNQTDNSAQSEERNFSAITFTPKLAMLFQVLQFFPNTDLLIGAEIQTNLSYLMLSDTPTAHPDWWSEEHDSIEYPNGGTYGLLLGVQGRF